MATLNRLKNESTKEPKSKKEPKPKKDLGPCCKICGKPISDPVSLKAGVGPLCRSRNMTKEQLAAKRQELTVEEPPAGWITVAEASNWCRSEGIPVSRLVRAFGGDRCDKPPVNPDFKLVYSGRSRWISPTFKKYRNLLEDQYLGQPKPERKKKAKKEGDVAKVKVSA